MKKLSYPLLRKMFSIWRAPATFNSRFGVSFLQFANVSQQEPPHTHTHTWTNDETITLWNTINNNNNQENESEDT